MAYKLEIKAEVHPSGKPSYELDTILGGNISFNHFSDVRLTGNIEIRDELDGFNYFKDLIRISITRKDLNEYEDKGVLLFDNFFIANKPKIITEGRVTGSSLVLNDLRSRLTKNVTSETIFVEEGETVNYKKFFDDNIGKTMNVVSDFPDDTFISASGVTFNIGTRYSEIVDWLCDTMVSERVVTDRVGGEWFFKGKVLSFLYNKDFSAEYHDGDNSVLYQEVENELDYSDIANVFVVVNSTEEGEPISCVIKNNDPNHPFSIRNIGMEITDFREESDYPTMEQLEAFTRRIASENSVRYGRIRISTWIDRCNFQAHETVKLNLESSNLKGEYWRVAYQFDLNAGAVMNQEFRQIVNFNT